MPRNVEELYQRKQLIKEALAKRGETVSSFAIKRLRATNASESEIADVLAAPPEILEEMTLAFIANLSPKEFERSLAVISGAEMPVEEVDLKMKVKEWMLRRGGAAKGRKEYGQLLLAEKDNVRDEEEEREYKEIEAILKGPDEGVIDLMLASADDKMLEKMASYALLDESFEATPAEAVVTAVAEVLRVESSEEDELWTDTEDDLIEDLNRLEFERDQPVKGANILKAFTSGRPKGRLTYSIRETQDNLARLQGGKLDRFKLRDLSQVELQHLLETTEAEIQDLHNLSTDTRDSINKIASHFNAPAGLADLVAPDAYAYPVYIKKRLASELKLRIKQAEREPNKPQQEAQRIAAEVQQMNDTITRLEQAREDAVRANPDQEAAIRKRFGKAIDAVKEGA